METSLDLRDATTTPAHTRAFYHLRELTPGDSTELWFGEPPDLVMEAVALQLRHNIVWRTEQTAPQTWRVTVQPRDDTHPRTLVDLLQRDHLRLDRLFLGARQALAAGQVALAGERLALTAQGLRRHIHGENEILAPGFTQSPRHL